MSLSANGWRANDRALVSRRPVPGTQVGLTVRNGAPGDLLLEVAARFDRDVQDIDNARGALDDWGYAERPIRGGRTLSNHASGTAIDLNATRWPLGKPASVNLTPAQIAATREIVGACLGVVVWGADWTRPDPMHFELARGSSGADCERALAALRAGHRPAEPTRALPTLRYGDRSPAVRKLQKFLVGTFPSYAQFEPSGYYGDATQAAVRTFQARAKVQGSPLDGSICGPATNAALAHFGWRG